MADKKTNWMKDLLIIPVIVGLVLWGASYFIPKFLEKGKQVTFTVDPPLMYIDTSDVPDAKVTYNGAPVNNLYGYRIRIWNSGDEAISSMPLQLRFDGGPKDFRILNVQHKTIPPAEFGKIDEQIISDTTRRYIYELLNTEDEDVITVITNGEAKISVFAKAKNLKIIEGKADENKTTFLGSQFEDFSFLLGLMSGIAGLMTLSLKRLIEKRKAKREFLKALRGETGGLCSRNAPPPKK